MMDKVKFYFRKIWLFVFVMTIAVWLLFLLGPNMLDSGPGGWVVFIVCLFGLLYALLTALWAVWKMKPPQGKTKKKAKANV